MSWQNFLDTLDVSIFRRDKRHLVTFFMLPVLILHLVIIKSWRCVHVCMYFFPSAVFRDLIIIVLFFNLEGTLGKVHLNKRGTERYVFLLDGLLICCKQVFYKNWKTTYIRGLNWQSQQLSHMCIWRISGVFNRIYTYDLCNACVMLLLTELWSHSDESRSICWALVYLWKDRRMKWMNEMFCEVQLRDEMKKWSSNFAGQFKQLCRCCIFYQHCDWLI